MLGGKLCKNTYSYDDGRPSWREHTDKLRRFTPRTGIPPTPPSEICHEYSKHALKSMYFSRHMASAQKNTLKKFS